MRLGEHVEVLARPCPTSFGVVVSADLALAKVSSLRRRRALVLLVAPLLALSVELQAGLDLHYPTRRWAVVQACLALRRFGQHVGVAVFWDQFRYGIHQGPLYVRPSLGVLAVCSQDTPTQLDQCVARGIRLQSSCATRRRVPYGSCMLDILMQRVWHSSQKLEMP